MNQCDLDDEGMRLFCLGLGVNSTLQVLSLKNNKIGDAGAKAFESAFAQEKMRLTHLYLSKNQIGDEGAKALARALRSLKLS